MKTTLSMIIIVFFMIFAIASNTFAQDYIRWSLPEGAKARLGKGEITGNVAYAPDGTRLAVASSIGIWVYDAQTGEELDLLAGHTGDVYSVSFSPDGSTLASGSSDGTIHLWDTGSGEHVRTLSGHTGWVESVSSVRMAARSLREVGERSICGTLAVENTSEPYRDIRIGSGA